MKSGKIRIGYRDIRIAFVRKVDAENSMGDFEDELGRIRIRKGLDDVEKANTILHEILHALCSVQGLHLSDKMEERIALAISNGMIDFMRENPRFITKIMKLLKTKKPRS